MRIRIYFIPGKYKYKKFANNLQSFVNISYPGRWTLLKRTQIVAIANAIGEPFGNFQTTML